MGKTKIICTIGPASAKDATLREMVKGGMNVARLNFSHGTHESHRETIALLRRVREEMGVPLAILLDTKGPEIRVGTFEHGEILLKEGQTFTLTGRKIEGSTNAVSITFPALAKNLKVGDRLLIDDGKLALCVTDLKDTDVICTVVTGGVLRNRKSINLPYISVDMPFLSERDREDLLFGIEQKVDYVAASFVRSGEDVRVLRAFLTAHGGGEIAIISKIENAEGVANFEEILTESDGIMVARGDMGVEIPFKKLPGIQKRLIRRTCEVGKLSVTATHMLESMIEKTTPTRAEITDVANAVFDGTSAIMLSGETAMGAHPSLAVSTMTEIADQAELDAEDVDHFRETVLRQEKNDDAFAMSDAACTIARDIGAKMIVAFTRAGDAAVDVSAFRPRAPIVALTADRSAYYRLALSWGVYPVLVPEKSTAADALDAAIAHARERGWISCGDSIVMTADLPDALNMTKGLVRIGIVPN